jgi:hypothetical protein
MRYISRMATRTTLALDEDVLSAAKAIAQFERRPTGAVLSDLARAGIEGRRKTQVSRAGFPVLPSRGVIITPEFVNSLRDGDE